MGKPGYRRVREEGGDETLVPAPGFVWRRLYVLLLPVLLVGIIIALAFRPAASLIFGTLVLSGLLLPVLLAAAMLGLALTMPLARRRCFVECGWPHAARLVMALALGLGVMALGMLGAGSLHLLGHGVPTGLILLAAAVGVGAVPTWQFGRGIDWKWWVGDLNGSADPGTGDAGDTRSGPGWVCLLSCGAVPVAMLLAAVCYHPGILWAREMGWYDVLEYHLQMPREYLQNGGTAPLPHNAYSFLPANVEMLYTLLLSLLTGARGGGVRAGDLMALTYLAQILHALLLLLGALGVALAPLRLRALGRVVIFLIVLGTPWSIIIGSQAYNDAGMVLYGGLALVWALGLVGAREGDVVAGGSTAMGDPAVKPAPRGPCPTGHGTLLMAVLIGGLLGLALGCKLTAGVMFAVPVAAVLLSCGRWKETLLAALIAGAVAAPWGVRSYVSTGNPVFPLAARTLGLGHWSAEQSQRWDFAHGAGGAGVGGHRISALAQASVLDDNWSISGANWERWSEDHKLPPRAETGGWRHLGWAWIIWLVAAAWALWRGRLARWPWRVALALGLQVTGWLFLTHLQARFLWPILPTLALLVAGVWAVDALPVKGVWSVFLTRGLTLVLAAVTVSTGFVVPQELKPVAGAQGAGSAGLSRDFLTGILLDNPALFSSPESWFRNAEGVLEGLPPQWRGEGGRGKLLLLGSATPYFYEAAVIYTTAWDRPAWTHILQIAETPTIAAWFRQLDIRLVVIDWAEIQRLNRSYGTPVPVTPAAVQGLVQSGLLKPVTLAVPLPYEVFLVSGE